MTQKDKRIYAIALTLVPGLGCRSCRHLLELYPDPVEIFSLSEKTLKELFGTHTNIIQNIHSQQTVARAAEEVATADRYHIRVLCMGDDDFPQRLSGSICGDCPTVLFVLGDCNLNSKRSLGIVGTRRATLHGKTETQHIVEGLRDEAVCVVSGLAYGIDSAAHTAALDCGLPTVAVLGHGLDRIYPPQNRALARRITEHGGALVTEYLYGTAISPSNFPARNRIIAGLSDGTVVVEAAEKGGALITAAIAGSYSREVMAVPGRPSDRYSSGCNNLVAENRATMVRNADDVMRIMNWEKISTPQQGVQQELFTQLDKTEQQVVDLLIASDGMTLDDIASSLNMTLPRTAALLLEMELRGIVHALPGSRYQVVEKR